MIRDVDLVSYLPDFMKDYQEPVAALEAENPEFYAVWKATDRVLYNRFIETADEYGISRYEKMLGIYPSEEETLESRRATVRSRWFSSLPYTWRMLLQKLTVLCGDTDFVITNNFDGEGYTITLITDLELFGEIEELERMLNGMVPCNIVFDCQNEIPCVPEDTIWHVGGGVTFAEGIVITGDFRESYDLKSDADMKGGVVGTAMLKFTNDFNETMTTGGDAKQASGSVFVDFVEIKSES